MPNPWFFALLLIGRLATPTWGGVILDEDFGSDLSNNPAVPTRLAFEPGDNEVYGRIGASYDPERGDLDFLTFTLGPGEQLEGIYLLEFSPSFDAAFHALAEGPTSVAPTSASPSDFVGLAHLAGNDASINRLSELGNGHSQLGGDPADDFTGPLGAGTYTYLIQQNGGSRGDYQRYGLNFVVGRGVPEPGTAWMLVAGVLVAACYHSRLSADRPRRLLSLRHDQRRARLIAR